MSIFILGREIGLRAAVVLTCTTFVLAMPHEGCAQASPSTVVLQAAPPGPEVSGGILIRELARQAVLLTARDELGLVTRDVVLGESLPADSMQTHLPLTVAVSIAAAPGGLTVNVRITHPAAGQPVELKAFSVTFLERDGLAGLTTQLEALTRQDLVAALEKAGLKKISPAPAADPKVEKPTADTDKKGPSGSLPDKVDLQLRRWNAIAQIAAVRRLHEENRKAGSSPASITALARGYAHLGTLTETHWSPVHKVFKARALLYAERLVAQSSNAATLQTRAYVRCLVGLPLYAFHDLEKAVEIGSQQSPKVELSAESRVIKAYCVGNSKQLLEFSGNKDEEILARYLNVLLVENVNLKSFTMQAAQALLELDPENLRAMEAMLNRAPLGIARGITQAAPEVFARFVPRELAEIGELPKSFKELVEDEPGNADAARKNLIDLTQELINFGAMAEGAGTSEQHAEPSVVAIGHMIREVNFLHAWRMMSFYKSTLSVNADDILESMLPLAEGHRYQAFLESYGWDKKTTDAAWKAAVPGITALDIEQTAEPMIRKIENANVKLHHELKAASIRHGDFVFRDLVDVMERSPAEQGLAATRLFRLSPESPVVIFFIITHNWDLAQPSAAKWETDYAEDLMVQEAFSQQYLKLKRLADAERCLQRRVKLLPDFDTYKALAELYLQTGNEAAWVQTQKEALKLPSQGLESSQVEVALADYYVNKKDFDSALEYAESAADSGAGWAMRSAAVCNELLENWKAAENHMQGIAERYENNGVEWYLWCQRTGHGNISAARKLATKTAAKLVAANVYSYQMDAAAFQYAEGQDAEVLALLKTSFERYRVPTDGLHAALLADEQGQPDVRDKLLAGSQRMAWADNNVKLGRLIQAFRAHLRKERHAPFDVTANEWLIHDKDRGIGTQLAYFIGKFLLLHDRQEDGTRILKWVASSPSGFQNCRVWASVLLQRRGIARDPMRSNEWSDDEPLREVLRTLYYLDQSIKVGDYVAAGQLAEKALKVKPDSIDALFARATVYRLQGDLDKALADYQKCLEIIPTALDPMIWASSCMRRKQDLTGAIEMYNRILKVAPDNSEAMLQLIPILDSSEDDKLRDGKRALELAIVLMNTEVDVSFQRKQVMLGEACAEVGNFPEAIRYLELAKKRPPPQHKDEIEPMLELFRQMKPFRRPNLKLGPT